MRDMKLGWEMVQLGHVVRDVNHQFDRESRSIERYVAGEHIDEGSLAIRRWGETDDGQFPPTFNRRFCAGDVLFHSRNLKKLACPDFDGITGEKLFVLRVNAPDRLIPELLPFLLQTQHFTEYANRMWAGSTNKFLNKTPLMKYEFALPPLEEQRRLLRLFRAMYASVDAAQRVEESASVVLSSLLARFYPATPKAERPLHEWCDNAITYGIVQAGPDLPGGVPYIRVSDMSSGIIEPDKLMRTAPHIAAKYARSRVETGDLVVALRGPIGLAVGIPSNLAGANLTQGTARVSVRPNLSADYVRWALSSPTIQSRISRVAKGSTFKEISLTSLRELPLPWIQPDEQTRVAEVLNQARETVRRGQDRVVEARTLFSRGVTETFVQRAA